MNRFVRNLVYFCKMSLELELWGIDKKGKWMERGFLGDILNKIYVGGCKEKNCRFLRKCIVRKEG